MPVREKAKVVYAYKRNWCRVKGTVSHGKPCDSIAPIIKKLSPFLDENFPYLKFSYFVNVAIGHP